MSNPLLAQEQPSTYFVQDRSNKEELKRLQIQSRMLTTTMGGLLPEQQDASHFLRVLDVGCGTGDWLIETARTYPFITALVGVDISKKMIDYAREQAEKQGVSDRVSFHVMDALRTLEFPDRSFDLVNQRLGQSFLRTWDWQNLLKEYRRVGKIGATVRITEGYVFAEEPGPALSQLGDLLLRALCQAGHFFSPTRDGLIDHLSDLLQKHGFQHVQTQKSHEIYKPGTPAAQLCADDMKLGYHTLLPFLKKWTHVPDNYEQIYQQMLSEIQLPDFLASAHMLTAWGTN